ncbi:MAG TPA: hypothetical protein VGG68_11560 [Caulobacteraceae bacterium]|jgi:hypothetical protein
MGNPTGGGKGSSGSQGGFNVTSGGAGLPFNFGPSPFDLSAIMSALGDNTASVTNRYKQLGLGGSTMEGQDLTGQQKIADATIGQEQTKTVSDPAINPSLQPSINSLIGVGSTQAANQGLTTALSSLANQANANSQFSSGAGSILSGANLDSTFSNLPANAFG